MDLITYLTKIRPLLEYSLPVLGGLPQYLKEELECVQRTSLWIIGLTPDHFHFLEDKRDKAVARELHIITRVKFTSRLQSTIAQYEILAQEQTI